MNRLIIVANRLPVTVERSEGDFKIIPSVGGLATGMSSLSESYDSIWVGFGGVAVDEVPERDYARIRKRLSDEFKCHDVALTSREVRLYYEGFSNRTIWPLFHYFPIYTDYDNETWDSYRTVNQKFLDTMASVLKPGDILWIHDYQLLLLSRIIRDRFSGIKIGFFLHIPFPSYEMFRLLPWRREILEGMLGADLIGFHTYSYERNFIDCVHRITGYESVFGQIRMKDRVIKVDSFPMGIDFERYSDTSGPDVARELKKLKKSLNGKKAVLSIDRLDYTKGIIQRLEAYDHFLQKKPEFRGKVQLFMVAVPSRTGVYRYAKLRREVNELVGRINGKYNTLEWSPINYMFRSVGTATLLALYAVADVALVTPLRDGMNLVAKEYIAARNRMDGALVLSEMAGVAEELGEALIVNPHNRQEVADAIERALTMPKSEQKVRMTRMRERIRRYDVFRWARTYMESLQMITDYQKNLRTRDLEGDLKEGILVRYRNAVKRLLLLDYDGTLTHFVKDPEEARPDSELFEILEKLAADEKNKVAIISGRDRKFLQKNFSSLPITLVAEHGIWIKETKSTWKTVANINTEWKAEVLPLLNFYVDRTPGSFVEEKEFSLAWHYRKADPEMSSIRSKELKSNILSIVSNMNLGIMEGNKVLEIKSLEVNKGKIALFLLSMDDYDFVLGIGDDTTDENLFDALPKGAVSIKVGPDISSANYCVASHRDVRSLLKEFTA